MAITKSNIKLMAAQELSDTDSGGGSMTAREIVDGNVNNLFTDISRLDRTIGRVSLRKAFPFVETADQSVYFGAHVILTDPPDDPGISVVLFDTDSFSDRRPAARNHMESYVVRSVLSRARLYDSQLVGQASVLLMQPPGLELPEIGAVYCLVEGDTEQFVKVKDLSVQEQTFTDTQGTYPLDIISLTLTDPLRYEFHGGSPARYDTTAQKTDPAVFRKTAAADAARYYGVTKLAQPISQNDLTFQVESIYAHLVPSSTSETPLADISAGGDAVKVIPAAHNPVSVVLTTGNRFFLGMGAARKSITITEGSSVFVDNGAGGFTRTAGASANQYEVVDYKTGEITASNSVTVTVEFLPAAPVTDIANTDEIAITLSNRGTTYVKTLNPIPAPGSLRLDYMALGKWYRLRDRGDGACYGDGDYGVASVNFATGTVTVTLAALPDVDTSVLFSWGGQQHYQILAGDAAILPTELHHSVAEGNIVPGSLVVTWLSGGLIKTATDNGAGVLTGDGTGRVSYQDGEVYLIPGGLPDAGQGITYDYESGAPVTDIFQPSPGPGDIVLALSQGPIMPGSLKVNWWTQWQQKTVDVDWQRSAGGGGGRTTILDTAQLRLQHSTADTGAGALVSVTGSTVNYTAGQVAFHPTEAGGYDYSYYDYRDSGQDWVKKTEADVFINGSAVTATYYPASDVPSTQQDVAAPTELKILLVPRLSNWIIPGSVRFTIGTKKYIDRAGLILTDIDSATNAGTVVGAVDYGSGIVTLSQWPAATNSITVDALLTQYGDWSLYKARFRTAGAPLQNASFSIRALSMPDGVLLSDEADADGNLASADIEGHVSIETGIVTVKFGRWVVAAGNEGEPWYDPAELDGAGNVWQPEPVDPTSMVYNAVLLSYLPIDADLIGVDPVRLPSDGRVPIFRPGYVCVIHYTTTQTCPDNLVAGQVIALTGGPWSLVELYDQASSQVDPALYTVDLVAGTVTLADSLDLGAYTQPLLAMKRIEDMKLVSDAQINGQITVTSKINHAYTEGVSYVSSALIIGDMGSRYFNLFSQETWTDVWSDDLIGGTTTAQYNDIVYPIIIRNDGAIEERWALIFDSATTFDIVGEAVGVIGAGTTEGSPGTFIAPVNPVTGNPYFAIQSDGFGAGWSTGNVIRFNTESANSPVWMARTTMPGPEVEPNDEVIIQIRGDAD